MFHSRSVKLAGLYLAIIMAISLFFSANIYQLSVQELERGIRRPGPSFNLPVDDNFPTRLRNQLLNEREQQFQEAKDRVLGRLLVINLFILVGGGALSYYLALRTLKPIEEAHSALERFTADASHELRTPITAMRSENEVALMNPKLTLPHAKQQLQSNIEELEKLTDLSEGLLRLASIENNDLPQEELSAETIVQKAVARVLPRAEKKNILINSKINTDANVIGDEASLVEALVILLDNAIKYSPEQIGITVQVDKEQKNVVFRVIDKGIGIKETELPYIFDRFYRADTSRTKQKIHGYGLGLAIAKNISEAHNGSLTATSAPGKGSTFILTLPAKN
ncbi:MAG: putative Histidine kinase [Candidatus Saccharibacteria bacterium]|nr:putative Histidine kinase [Candidatus Saccharibacteria bacterium]